MSSTNKTANYDLSQYVGTDKPTYLGDYNGDMLKIDTQMKANADASTNAQSSAGEALAKAIQAQNDVDSLDERVAQNETEITSLKSTVTSQGNILTQTTATANTAKSTADEAKSSADGANGTLSKNIWTTPTEVSYATNVNPNSDYPIKAEQNLFLNLLMIHGTATCSGTIPANSPLLTLPSSIKRPLSERKMAMFGLKRDTSGEITSINGTLGTDGVFRTAGQIPNGTAVYFQGAFQTSDWY